MREIDVRWARRFVKERVDIGMILREAGLGYDSEFPLLVYTSGSARWMNFILRRLNE